MAKHEREGESRQMWKEGTEALEKENEQEVKDIYSLFWHWGGLDVCEGHPSVPLR